MAWFDSLTAGAVLPRHAMSTVAGRAIRDWNLPRGSRYRISARKKYYDDNVPIYKFYAR